MKAVAVVLACVALAGCGSPILSATAISAVPTVVASPAGLPTRSVPPLASATPVGGGCGDTQVFAGPGPDASSGLANNPWAQASPAVSGIVAYFWYAPPDLLVAHGLANHTKILWLSGADQAAQISIEAHPLSSPAPAVSFSFPASASGGYPSAIDLPSPGCWELELTLGATYAAMDLMVAPVGSP
jgi:hypothetical protein